MQFGGGGGVGGCTISPCGPPPQGVLTLILLHVSPISTNGAAIVPPLCAVLPSAQSPWVSKLSAVMFPLLPTHTGIHDNGGHPATRPIHWHSVQAAGTPDVTVSNSHHWYKRTELWFLLYKDQLQQGWVICCYLSPLSREKIQTSLHISSNCFSCFFVCLGFFLSLLTESFAIFLPLQQLSSLFKVFPANHQKHTNIKQNWTVQYQFYPNFSDWRIWWHKIKQYRD